MLDIAAGYRIGQ